MDGKDQDFRQLMHEQAEEAVQSARDDYGVFLDYSMDSLPELYKLLKRAHILYSSPGYAGKNPARTIQVWGAYLGETIRRANNGTWKENPAANENRRYSVTIPSGSIFPMEQVYLKVVPGIQTRNLMSAIKEPPTRRVRSDRGLYLLLGILVLIVITVGFGMIYIR